MKTWSTRRVTFWSLVVLALIGCAAPGGLFGETTGEKFRKVLAQIDATCKDRRLGPYLDPSDPEYRNKATLTNCDVLKVKPFDLDAVLATAEGKLAYSIKLPPPHDKPRVNRRDFSSAESYFNALCEKEAGDYIFKSINGVDGIALLRTPLRPWQQRLGFVSEESGGFSGGSNPEERLLTSRPSFNFVERPARDDELIRFSKTLLLRFSKEPGREIKLPDFGLRVEPVSRFSARYGYIWRGTEYLNDRENGIVGGDVLVIDLQTNEVLALRRSFTLYEVDTRKIDRLEMSTKLCLGTSRSEGFEFLTKVLHPRAR
ncbi:MAG: hypothetical protein ACREC3_07930 [Methyloceanibacter sp.]